MSYVSANLSLDKTLKAAAKAKAKSERKTFSAHVSHLLRENLGWNASFKQLAQPPPALSSQKGGQR